MQWSQRRTVGLPDTFPGFADSTDDPSAGGRSSGWRSALPWLLVAGCSVWAGACQPDTSCADGSHAPSDAATDTGARDTGGETSTPDGLGDTSPDTRGTADTRDAADTRSDADGGPGPESNPESKFERETSLPSCDSNDPEVAIIGPNTYQKHDPFQDALNDPNKRIFCLKPGDYRGLGGQWGIFLKTGGTENKRRYLVYYNPSMPRDRHPWNMDDPDKKTGAKRVLFPKVQLRSSYWTFDRIRFDSGSGGVKVQGAHHVTIDRSMFYQMPNGDPDVQAVTVTDSHHVWIQNSVMGDFPQWNVGDGSSAFDRGTNGDDNLALLVTDSDYVYFVDNEAWDPFNGDIVQTQAVNTQQSAIKRTVIADNDMWLTPDMHDEPYENAIDFKKGPDGGPKSGWAVIQNNRIWNFNNKSNQLSWNVITTHGQSNTSGFLIRNNVLWDNQAAAISISTPDAKHVIEDNVIYNQQPTTSVYGKGGVILGASGKTRFARNVLVDSETDELWDSGGNTPHDVELRHNVFVNSDLGVPQHEPANTVEENAFYDSTPFDGNNPNSITEPSAGAANHGDLKVRVREITGPNTIRVPNTNVTPRSPHSNWFSSN